MSRQRIQTVHATVRPAVIFTAALGLALHAVPCGAQAPATRPGKAAAAKAAPGPGETAASQPIAATVNGQPIFVGEVARAVASTLKQLGAGATAVPALEAQVLNQVIDQRLIEGFLKKSGGGPKADEVDAEIARLKNRLRQEGGSYEKFLADRGWTDSSIRDRLVWSLGWPKYLKEQLTDDALSKFFSEHRRQYDGGQVRASQILLRIEGPRDPQAVEAALAKAQAIRQQIESGKLTFEAAAERYSDGPSRLKGGDQGYFPRQGVMLEPFAEAAFALGPNQISQPVLTHVGVHLIKVTDAKPGTLGWKESRARLEADLGRELFAKLGEAERATAKIEFTGLVPYFKPGTNELVVPGQATAASK